MKILNEADFKATIEELVSQAHSPFYEIKKIAPEDVPVVGWGIFLSCHTAPDIDARLRYIYKERSKALAKLSDLMPENGRILAHYIQW